MKGNPETAGTRTDKNRPLSQRIKRFLRAYARCGYVKRACRMAEVGIGLHYWWYETSERYRKRFNRAHRRAGHLRRDVLNKLAIAGQPKFHDGEQVFIYFDAKGTPIPKSDALDVAGKLRKGFSRKPATEINVTALIFALKADFPEYRERQEVNHTGNVTRTVRGKVKHEFDVEQLAREFEEVRRERITAEGRLLPTDRN